MSGYNSAAYTAGSELSFRIWYLEEVVNPQPPGSFQHELLSTSRPFAFSKNNPQLFVSIIK